jgi:hypothetical protein
MPLLAEKAEKGDCVPINCFNSRKVPHCRRIAQYLPMGQRVGKSIGARLGEGPPLLSGRTTSPQHPSAIPQHPQTHPTTSPQHPRSVSLTESFLSHAGLNGDIPHTFPTICAGPGLSLSTFSQRRGCCGDVVRPDRRGGPSPNRAPTDLPTLCYGCGTEPTTCAERNLSSSSGQALCFSFIICIHQRIFSSLRAHSLIHVRDQ